MNDLNSTERLPDLAVFGLSVQVVTTDTPLTSSYLTGPGAHPVLIVPDASGELTAQGVFAYLCDRALAIGGHTPTVLFGLLRDNPQHFTHLMRAEPPDDVMVALPDLTLVSH